MSKKTNWSEDAIRFAAEEYNDIISNNQLGEDVPEFIGVKHVKDLGEANGMNRGITINNRVNAERITEPDKWRINESLESHDKWTIITLYEKENPARKGAIKGDRFITGAGHKNERRLIDEKNKVIIQTPYEPGMDRHIWG